MKKALALSMALAMSAAMLAGCGGSASGSTSASGAASSADSAASGTPTVSFMIPDFTGHVLSNEHSDEVIAKYEAYTGTHVEWRTEANDTYSEKFGLTRERVRQIKEKAIRRLRHSSRSKLLKTYLG